MAAIQCRGVRKATLPLHVYANGTFDEAGLDERFMEIAREIVLFAQDFSRTSWEWYDMDDVASYLTGDHNRNVTLLEEMTRAGFLAQKEGRVTVTESFLVAIKQYVE